MKGCSCEQPPISEVKSLLFPAGVLNEVGVLVHNRSRIREELVFAFDEAYLVASVDSLVSRDGVEAAVGFCAILPVGSLT